ncbi:lipoprotein LpqH [Mycobacterium sp. NPDC003323]
MRAPAVLILVAALATGCAAAPAPTQIPVPAPASPEPPMPTDSVPRGRAQVIVNGDLGPTGPVACDTEDGLTTISVGDALLGVTLIVTDDDMPAVRSVSIGDVGGVALAYSSDVSAAGAAARTPTALRNGPTLIVTGSGSGTDSSNPARIVDSGYRIAVACP